MRYNYCSRGRIVYSYKHEKWLSISILILALDRAFHKLAFISRVVLKGANDPEHPRISYAPTTQHASRGHGGKHNIILMYSTVDHNDRRIIILFLFCPSESFS